MKIITINSKNFDSTVAKASAIVKAGGVIIYPTDTCYGIGGLKINPVEDKISKIKGRESNKKYSIIIDSIEAINKFAEVNPKQADMLKKNLPGPFTFVLKTKTNQETIGIRIPQHNFSIQLVKTIGQPVLSTSANLSGGENAYNLDQIKKGILASQFANLIDLIIIADNSEQIAPSTIIDLTKNKPIIIRSGSGVFKQ